MDPSKAEDYNNPAQIARVTTESWVSKNMYCPACLNDELEHTRTGKPVVDYKCPACDESYQLKSKKTPFRKKISNSAYQNKIDAIRKGTIPNFAFLRYDPGDWIVKELFVVPKHFMTKTIIEKRKPLSDEARRSGWVGSNILLGNLPNDARISIIQDEHEINREFVKVRWNRFSFMQKQTVESRGWLSDVLMCIRRMNESTFTLQQVYDFEGELSELHPKNKHIRPKIRQQLQVLRDKGVIDFLGDGWYQIRDLEAAEK